jgi:hypothetical protein
MTDYILSVDMGKISDPSGIVLLARTSKDNSDSFIYDIVFVEDVPLGTAYRDVVNRIAEITRNEHLGLFNLINVVYDKGGVGVAVSELIQEDPYLVNISWGITISAGRHFNKDPHDLMGFSVPKKDLVGVLQVALQDRSIRAHPDLPNASLLRKQLLEFQYEVRKTQNILYEAKGNEKDDIVLALMMGVWLGENIPQEDGMSGISSSNAPSRLSSGDVRYGRVAAPSWRDKSMIDHGGKYV